MLYKRKSTFLKKKKLSFILSVKSFRRKPIVMGTAFSSTSILMKKKDRNNHLLLFFLLSFILPSYFICQ